jgi:hypothetical protein
MGILEEIFDLAKKFLEEQKKTNQLLETLINQNYIKNDFIIKGQKETAYILGCSIPTLTKALNENKLKLEW